MCSQQLGQQGGPQPGTAIAGRYRIISRIASGGMSTVYRCYDKALGNDVAVKLMKAELTADRAFHNRFKREARTMGAYRKNSHFVSVYDAGVTIINGQERAFLVMEMVDGGTLRELLAERAAMPPYAAVAVMRPLLAGLSDLHRDGLIHRDIKPDNVLITTGNDILLTDFGLVRRADSPTSPHAASGQVIGTADYVSPEQVYDQPLGCTSDVYQAGIVFYKMLTNEVPFTQGDENERMRARLTQDVPAPSSVIAGIPPLIDALVATATDRDPAARFADAGEFLAALDDVADTLGIRPFTVPAPTHGRAHHAALVQDSFERTNLLPQATGLYEAEAHGAEPAELLDSQSSSTGHNAAGNNAAAHNAAAYNAAAHKTADPAAATAVLPGAIEAANAATTVLSGGLAAAAAATTVLPGAPGALGTGTPGHPGAGAPADGATQNGRGESNYNHNDKNGDAKNDDFKNSDDNNISPNLRQGNYASDRLFVDSATTVLPVGPQAGSAPGLFADGASGEGAEATRVIPGLFDLPPQPQADKQTDPSYVPLGRDYQSPDRGLSQSPISGGGLTPQPLAPSPQPYPAEELAYSRTASRADNGASNGAERLSDQPDWESHKKSNNRSPVAAAFFYLISIALVLAVACASWWFVTGRYGEIPQLLGMSETQATATLKAAGFSDVAVDHEYSNDVAKGEVVGVQPDSGSRLPKARKVGLIVSLGRPEVPAFAGLSVTDFRAALADRTLVPAMAPAVYSDSVPDGGIVSVNPPVGETVSVGTVITIVTSKGAAPVKVPQLTGLSLDEARKQLTALGLAVGTITQEFKANGKAAAVLDTVPTSGEKVAKGSLVNLTVNSGIEVPDVTGMSRTDAQVALAEAGISVGSAITTNAASAVAGGVVRTAPAAGSLVDPAEAQVDLFIADSVLVPSVVGQTIASAREQLEGLGLQLNTDAEDDEFIYSQSPKSGKKVQLGSQITVKSI